MYFAKPNACHVPTSSFSHIRSNSIPSVENFAKQKKQYIYTGLSPKNSFIPRCTKSTLQILNTVSELIETKILVKSAKSSHRAYRCKKYEELETIWVLMTQFYYDAAYLCYVFLIYVLVLYGFFSQNICWLEAKGTGVLI